jgi:hypothetical protein
VAIYRIPAIRGIRGSPGIRGSRGIRTVDRSSARAPSASP